MADKVERFGTFVRRIFQFTDVRVLTSAPVPLKFPGWSGDSFLGVLLRTRSIVSNPVFRYCSMRFQTGVTQAMMNAFEEISLEHD
jgi:hypothetical protein